MAFTNNPKVVLNEIPLFALPLGRVDFTHSMRHDVDSMHTRTFLALYLNLESLESPVKDGENESLLEFPAFFFFSDVGGRSNRTVSDLNYGARLRRHNDHVWKKGATAGLIVCILTKSQKK